MGDLVEGADPVLAEGTKVGDFRIQRLLGEGAMGQVYLAQDTTLGRRVALKLIKRSVMRRDGAERFLEEARATASFNHPHIVTLYAVGEHDGRPYLALEYIEGPSLRARLAAGPLPIRAALRCCRAVAEAIAEAHRRGLVHADLKPENVIIPDDGRVRVVDFGLARLAQSAPNAASGTPAYMAPERWRGAPPTGAIDVWALGVMLHELITGRRPIDNDAFFHGLFTADAIELPGLPAAPWAQLVRSCLAIDPMVRPGAEEVVRQLTAMLDPHAASDDDGGAHANEPAVVSQLAETQPFEGRRETMAALVHGGRAALASRTPTLVTIRGDAGIGKTRLATALHRAMTQAIPEARVLSFRAQDHGGGEIDETLRSILRRLLVSPSEMTVRPEEMRAHLQAQVGEGWPAVALTLGWIGRDAPELQAQARAPGALRIAAIEATGGLIRRAVEQGPLCIILDDAHLADGTTLDALELATLERAGAAPLWICVLVRPSFDALRPAWGERAERAEAIELEPLPDTAAEELCRTLLHPAENLPAHLVERITARAQGNAMLLGELCRALKTEGIIRQERTGAWILETDRVDEWPHTPRLQWLAERELRRLAPELVGPAQLATVLGPRFAVADMIGIIEVLEASPAAHRFALDPVVALTRLEQAQLLRVRGRHHCELRNAALCETMRAAIPEALRVELHRAAYEHYRDLRRLPEEQRRPRVAFHAAEAGLREPAARAYEALAAEYLYRHRYVEAESAFSRMLALVDEAPRRQGALHGRGLARYRTGRYEDALADLHGAHELAEGLGDRRARLALLLDEATVLDW
ncbi:MAG TPA: protein kinase, partial [Kofleriaceae bacterium]|nr:protein kinase [Kofleriaceae bacterium]